MKGTKFMLNKKIYNEEEFIKKYDMYSRMILNICYTYLKSTSLSEDIMQDVFFKYIYKNPKFNNLENEKAWFIRVSINLCKDYIKSSWNKKREDWPEEDVSYLQNSEYEVLSEINNLSSKYRIVIYLYYYEGYSIKEISKILKENENTIGIRLSRARQKLKIELEEKENG